MTTSPSAVNYGLDTSIAYRTVLLPFPDGTSRLVTCEQPTIAMNTISGRRRLAEDLVRRLWTTRGTLISEKVPSDTSNYGTCILDYVNDDIDTRKLAIMSSNVDAEYRKDPRVVRSTTTSQFLSGVLILNSNIVDGAGPFPLVLSVADYITTLRGPQ